jgi:hypothetical protein
MKKGLAVTLVMAAVALTHGTLTYAEAPTINAPPDVIIGDLEGATSAATGTNVFVFPDAFSLSGLFISDDNVTSTTVRWSFVDASGRYELNGVESLDIGGGEDPRNPGTADISQANDDAGDTTPAGPMNATNVPEGQPRDPEADGLADTVTFRDVDLSPDNTNPGEPAGGMAVGSLTDVVNSAMISLWAGDGTTATAQMMMVYTSNNTTDGLTGGGAVVVPLGAATDRDFTGFTDLPGLAAAGWTFSDFFTGLLTATGTVGTSGMCVETQLVGDAGGIWRSDEGYVPLVDNALYRIRVRANHSQANGSNTQALWDILLANFNGAVVTFGDQQWSFENTGSANGIGAGGRTDIIVYSAPNSHALPAWRGTLPGGGSNPDNALSAFDPSNASFRDMQIQIRMLDIGAGLQADQRSGTLCIEEITVGRVDVSDIQVIASFYGSDAGDLDATAYNAIDLFGTSVFNGDGTITVDMGPAPGPAVPPATNDIDRFILQPNVGGSSTTNADQYPIPYVDSDVLYRMRIGMTNGVSGSASAGTIDPLDIISMNWNAITTEVGKIGFTTRGAPGGALDRAASPRSLADGGVVSEYVSYLYSQAATLVDTGLLPDADRLRGFLDVFNFDAIGASGAIGPSGDDPFTIEYFVLEQVEVPTGGN